LAVSTEVTVYVTASTDVCKGVVEMRAYRIDTESDAIFDFEISRCAPLELGRIGDERFA
jgi:hypothetical protein